MRPTVSLALLVLATLCLTGAGCQRLKSFTTRIFPTTRASAATKPVADAKDPTKTDDPAAAADDDEANKPPEKPLYVRLGGERAIVALVDDFVPRVLANPRVNFARANTPRPWQPTPDNVARLKQRFVQFFGTATGGPQKYEGEDMVTAHRGLRVTHAEFDALLDDLRASMTKLNAAAKEQKDVIDLVEAARGAMVEEKPGAAVGR